MLFFCCEEKNLPRPNPGRSRALIVFRKEINLLCVSVNFQPYLLLKVSESCWNAFKVNLVRISGVRVQNQSLMTTVKAMPEH